jgi:hypothetical protein
VTTAAENHLSFRAQSGTRRLRQPAIAEQSRFMSTRPKLSAPEKFPKTQAHGELLINGPSMRSMARRSFPNVRTPQPASVSADAAGKNLRYRRVAQMRDLLKLLKDFYNTRSRVIHGENLQAKHQTLLQRVDELRKHCKAIVGRFHSTRKYETCRVRKEFLAREIGWHACEYSGAREIASGTRAIVAVDESVEEIGRKAAFRPRISLESTNFELTKIFCSA